MKRYLLRVMVLALILLLSRQGIAESVLIDFEELSRGTRVTNEYQSLGALFSGTDNWSTMIFEVGDYGTGYFGNSGPKIMDIGYYGHSTTIKFVIPNTDIPTVAYNFSMLAGDGASGSETFTVSMFDLDGNTLFSKTYTTYANGELIQYSGNVASVKILLEGDSASGACIDDISFNIANLIDLPAGWSMISLPFIPDNATAADVFPDAVVIYGYKRGVGYKRVQAGEDLEARKGYWILLNEAKTYTLTGQPVVNYTLDVNEDGWSMIGGCSSLAKASSNNCDIGVVYEYEQGLGYKRVPEGENLKPGKGYWILLENVTGQASLTVQPMGE